MASYAGVTTSGRLQRPLKDVMVRSWLLKLRRPQLLLQPQHLPQHLLLLQHQRRLLRPPQHLSPQLLRK